MRVNLLLFLLVFLLLSGCSSIPEESVERRTATSEYEIVTADEDGNLSFLNKTLGQISNEDLVDGFFTYRSEGGELIVTNIENELNRIIVDAYPADEKYEYVRRWDEWYGNVSLVVYNQELLSHNKALQVLPPEFFMQDYSLNWHCMAYLESSARLNQCGWNFNCEIEADHYFEEWCLESISEHTGDESWCEKHRLALSDNSDCYTNRAIQKKDEDLCWRITGDISVVQCFSRVAAYAVNETVCDDIRYWYQQEAIEHEKNISVVEPLYTEPIELCKQAVREIDVNILADCTRADSPNRQICFDNYIKNHPEITIYDCEKQLPFVYVGYCYNTFGISEKNRDLYRRFGNNICKYESLNSPEIEIAGRVHQIGTMGSYSVIGIVPLFGIYEKACRDVDCFIKGDVSYLNESYGVHARTSKQPIYGRERCFIDSIETVYPPGESPIDVKEFLRQKAAAEEAQRQRIEGLIEAGQCDELEGKDLDRCQLTRSQDMGDTHERLLLCQSIGDHEVRFECALKSAEITTNASRAYAYCSIINWNKGMWIECYDYFRKLRVNPCIEDSDVEECPLIPCLEKSNYRMCFSNYGEEYEDPEGCNVLDKPEECYFEVALSTANLNSCEFIADGDMRNRCLKEVLTGVKGALTCLGIHGSNYQVDCLRGVFETELAELSPERRDGYINVLIVG